MATEIGLNTNELDAVLIIDMGDPACFRGAPTTNIGYSTSQYLDSGSNWWVNGGGADFNDNDTTIDKPYIPNVDTSGLRVFSAKTTSLPPNQHIGSRIMPVSPNTQYSFQIWFYYTGTSMQAQPYVRGAVGNYPISYFAYNGDTNYLNWPRSKWILLKTTFTTDGSENGVYMSSYIGDTIGEKVAYFGYQLERASHCSALVLGTRSETQSVYDLSLLNNTLTVGCSFDSDGYPTFDGSNDYIDIANSSLVAGYDEFTIEAVYTLNSGSGVIIGNYGPGYTSNSVWMYSGGMHLNGGHGYTSNPAGTHHLVCVRTKNGNFRTYRNGELVTNNTTSTANIVTNINWKIGVDVNSTTSEPFNGKIHALRVYKRVLKDQEVYKNYLKYKSRFSI